VVYYRPVHNVDYMRTDRRSFVKASGMAAVLGATGLAGCGGILGGGGGGTAGDYLYDPTVVADVPNVAFGSMAYGTFYDNRDELPESMQGDFETDPDSPMQPEDVDEIAGVGGGDLSQDGQSMSAFGSVVVTGSIPRSEVESEIESEGEAESAGTYEGYSMYEVSSFEDGMTSVPGSSEFQGSGSVGVGDSAMVIGVSISQGSDSAATGESATKTMIDTSSGNARELSASDGPATTVQDRLGDRMMAFGAGVDPELVSLAQQMGGGGGGMGGQMLAGMRGGGFGADVNGETTTFVFLAVYDSEGSATDAGLADLVSGMSSRFEQEEGIDSVESNQDGAVVEVTVEGDTQTLAEQGSGAGSTFSVAAPR